MTVSPLQGITHACFGLSYLLAFALELARLCWPRAACCAVAGLAFGGRRRCSPTPLYLALPPAHPGRPVRLAAAARVGARPVLPLRHRPPRQAGVGRVRAAGRHRARRAVAALSHRRHRHRRSTSRRGSSGERFWGASTASLILLASVGVSVGFLASMMYLVQARRLRKKVNPARRACRCSASNASKTMNRRALNCGVPAAHRRAARRHAARCGTTTALGDNWLSLKVLSTAGLWVVFLVLLYLRYGVARPGAAAGAAVRRRVRAAARGAGGRRTRSRRGCEVNLRAIGCNVATAAVELRERLAFDAGEARAARSPNCRPGSAAEAVVLGTCNRVELYVARPDDGRPLHIAARSPSSSPKSTACPPSDIQPHLYEHADADAVRHLFRVAGQPRQLVVGEGQIAGQVKEAFEAAPEGRRDRAAAERAVPGGPARLEARPHRDRHRARARLGVERRGATSCGRCSTHFTDKTVLVIGAGEDGPADAEAPRRN